MSCDGTCNDGWVGVFLEPYYRNDLPGDTHAWTVCGVDSHQGRSPFGQLASKWVERREAEDAAKEDQAHGEGA